GADCKPRTIGVIADRQRRKIDAVSVKAEPEPRGGHGKAGDHNAPSGIAHRSFRSWAVLLPCAQRVTRISINLTKPCFGIHRGSPSRISVAPKVRRISHLAKRVGAHHSPSRRRSKLTRSQSSQ